MKSFVFAAFIILTTAFGYKTISEKDAELDCTLTSDKTFYKIGEVPVLKVEITNNTNKQICLIGSLDGSDLKWRMPYCYYTIEKPKPDTVKFSRCGNVNPLRVEDFKIVKPGDRFNPYQTIDMYGFFGDYLITNKESFKNAGVYKIQFHYSTNAQNILEFMGRFNSVLKDSVKIKTLLKEVPKVNLVSNEIELKFEE